MKERKTADYVGSVIGNGIALVLVNLVLLWRPWTRGVVLESWVDILWAADLSLVLQIVGNLILAVYRPRWLDASLQVILAAAGLLSLIVFYLVFPLDFSMIVGEWLNLTLRVVLVVGMVGTAIGVIVHLVRLGGAAQARA